MRADFFRRLRASGLTQRDFTEAERIGTAIGRAPIVKMSRRIPPTPVVAPGKVRRNSGDVRFDFEGGNEAVADVDDACVLRALHNEFARVGRR